MSVEDVGHPRVGGLPCVCPECVKKRTVNRSPAFQAKTAAQQELLPCPFCGATATRGMFNVWCDACQAQTVCDSDASTEQIIASWNTRYRDPAFQKLVEAAEAALVNIQGLLDNDDLPSIVVRNMLREALRLARQGEGGK